MQAGTPVKPTGVDSWTLSSKQPSSKTTHGEFYIAASTRAGLAWSKARAGMKADVGNGAGHAGTNGRMTSSQCGLNCRSTSKTVRPVVTSSFMTFAGSIR